MRRMILPIFALLMTPAAAQAKWIEASSQNFVIYANETPADLQEFADQLERFHHALGLAMSGTQEKPSPSNRVTIYVVRDPQEVRKLQGSGERFTYAFYKPQAGGSFAIVPRVKTGQGELDMPMIALLHEYVHHFMHASTSRAWPTWLWEGAAEFYSSARFPTDGSVILGLPAQHRAAELYYSPDVSARNLLEHARGIAGLHNKESAYYGKSWLLYHYLTFSIERQGQFYSYMKLMLEGKSSLTAAETAFGDLDVLERELDRYINKKLTTLKVQPHALKPGPVTIRDLSAGEAAMMPLRIRLKNSDIPEQTAEFLPDVRAMAARFPGEATVLATLAQAEYKAGNDNAAITAADAALAIDAGQIEAQLNKGMAMFRKALEADVPSVAFAEARKPFLAVNAVENDHPIPLIYMYLSFTNQGIAPTKNAIAALERAAQLAPFDLNVRFMLAAQMFRDKRYDEAIIHLSPIAFNPHGGSGAEKAQRMLDRLKQRDTLGDPTWHDMVTELSVKPVEIPDESK